MASVKLKTNMIIEGQFFRFGTVIDESKVPPRYRKKQYILREGEIDYREKERLEQMAIAEQELEDLNRSNDIEGMEPEEEVKPRRVIRRRYQSLLEILV